MLKSARAWRKLTKKEHCCKNYNNIYKYHWITTTSGFRFPGSMYLILQPWSNILINIVAHSPYKLKHQKTHHCITENYGGEATLYSGAILKGKYQSGTKNKDQSRAALSHKENSGAYITRKKVWNLVLVSRPKKIYSWNLNLQLTRSSAAPATSQCAKRGLQWLMYHIPHGKCTRDKFF